MDRLFGRRHDGHEACPTNLWANEHGARLVARLPGLTANDVEVTVEGAEVRLARTSVTTSPPATASTPETNGTPSSNRERVEASFSRTFRLPFPVDAERVRATFANGRLEIELPRRDSDRPRRIDVTTVQPNTTLTN